MLQIKNAGFIDIVDKKKTTTLFISSLELIFKPTDFF